jgi:hypothetical protein
MLTASAVTFLTLAVSEATAQPTPQSIAGTYSAVSVPAFGKKPYGLMILTAEGHYSIIVRRAKLAPIASGTRTSGTAAENKALADGSIAHFGEYTIDDGGRSITFHVDRSSFPNWDSQPQKRGLIVNGELLTYRVEMPSIGGPPNDVTWKRIK